MKENKLYKILTLIVAVMTVFAVLAGCGDDEPKKEQITAEPTDVPESSPTNDPTPSPSEEPEPSASDIPTASPDQNTPEPATPTPAPVTDVPDGSVAFWSFLEQFGGTWTADDGEFIDIGEEEGGAYMLFAVWNAGGDFPVGHISKVKTYNGKDYKLHMSFGEDHEADYNLRIVSDYSVELSSDGGESKTYIYYYCRQFPNDGVSVDPIEFVSKFSGFWTESKDKEENVQFLNKEGIATMSFGIWSSEYREYGEIVNVTVESDEITYDVEVYWYEVPELSSPAHTGYYRIKANGSESIDLNYDGTEFVLTYCYDTDSHSSIPDITKAAAMTEDEILDYLGNYHGRAVADWWKEYIVEDDDIFVTYKDPVSGKKFRCMCTDDYILVMVQFV